MTTFIHLMRGIYGLWAREATVYRREYSRIVSSLFSPIIWLVFVGTGFSSFVAPENLGGASYRDFMFSGIIAMSVLFITVFYGLYIVWDRKMDVLKAVLVTPIPRWGLFFGKVLGGATEGVVQAVLVLVLGWPLVRYDPVVVPAVVLFVVLIAIALTSVGLALGSYFESFEGFQLTSTFLVFPMFFASGALYPTSTLPSWFQGFAVVNPLTYAVDAFRGLLLGPQFYEFGLVTDFLVLSGFAALMIVIGGVSFQRMK